MGKANDKVKLKGEITFRVYRNGKLRLERKVKNTIVNVGKAQVAGLINGVVTTPFTYIAIGTGTTAASASDTGLENETHREAATTSRETTSVTNDTAVLQVTFSGYAASGGNMLCRRTFSAINVDWDAGDALQVTWKITVS